MLDVALGFLCKELNTYLSSRGGGNLGEVVFDRLVDDTGKWALKDDQIGATLINLEEDRILKSHVPESVYTGGRQVTLEPKLKLNLHVLFAAKFKNYDQGLRHLALVLTFFQSHLTFTPDAYPRLDPRIERLTAELQSLGYEQLNQVWAFLGGKYLPSAIYKIRMVALQDTAPKAIEMPITEIDAPLFAR
ncbi:DUF4255 domain-containing protein [Sorangium sp. So ce385]|uniref:DUF4255 domain-containing protein n=1 Tax=Sorangium sp. So ce385 TaxID=3133308 RepID=UPI003F5C0EC7